MKLARGRCSRWVAMGAAVVGGAALMLALPSLGQQEPRELPVQPDPEGLSIQATVPATAARGPVTRVNYQFTPPDDFVLVRPPRVRVVDADGKMVELLSMYILQRRPSWAGFRWLHTSAYPAGTYQVRVQVHYKRGDGVTRTAVTPAQSLVVPDRKR